MDLINKTLGQYQILEPLGRGGMATIFKAYQPSLDRQVAIKILFPQQTLTPDFAQRFVREARAVAQLNHPNILPIFDFGREQDQSYIVMKLVTGGTLKDRLGQPVDLSDTTRFIEQIAAALDHAHERDILHRDVKPSNVLLDEGDWVQLADFGLTKILSSDDKISMSDFSIGTPAYRSPEQGQGLPINHCTDIYSLGVVLYEMVTGRVPFKAKTPMATILKHIQQAPPLPCTINPTLSPKVQQVILKALAKSPNERFASAGELAQTLQRAVAEPSEPSSFSAPEPVTGPPVSVQAVSEPAMSTTTDRQLFIDLHQVLSQRFSKGEFQTLCFYLGTAIPAHGEFPIELASPDSQGQ